MPSRRRLKAVIHLNARIERLMHPYAKIGVQNKLLEGLSQEAFAGGPGGSSPYIHPRMLSYLSEESQAYWTQGAHDQEKPGDRDYLWKFWKSVSRQASTRIGVFTTWLQSEVKYGTPRPGQEWHCWGAALVSGPKKQGKHLFIWDPAGGGFHPEGIKASKLLLGSQMRLVREIQKNFSLRSLWLFQGEDRQRECLKLTMKWALDKMVEVDSELVPDDPRFLGFKELKMIY
ncbi:MAG: hypothetical protein Q9183_004977 [Haloplaca sp. 2 TL-2023]